MMREIVRVVKNDGYYIVVSDSDSRASYIVNSSTKLLSIQTVVSTAIHSSDDITMITPSNEFYLYILQIKKK